MGWARIAKRVVRELLLRQEYDVILTSSGSYTAHFIGSWTAKNHNLCWIADYGDPWSLDKYGRQGKLTSIIEKRILIHVSGLIFTTKETIRSYEAAFPEIQAKTCYIPCGYPVNYDTTLSIKKVHDPNHFNITYTGVAYSLSRNLTNAIAAVSRMSHHQVYLNIVGSFSQKYVNYTEKIEATNINYLGKVSYSKSLKIIAEANILLHIGNYGSMQIPGKTYIYLGSGKPIIYISQEDEYDPTFHLLKQFEGIIYCKNNIGDILEKVNKVISNYQYYHNISKTRLSNPSLSQFSLVSINRNYKHFISQIVKAHKV